MMISIIRLPLFAEIRRGLGLRRLQDDGEFRTERNAC